MKTITSVTALTLLIMLSCGSVNTKNDKKVKKEKTRYVLVETKFGNMKLKLYNETPLHRDNFLKLVKDGFYDSLLFHRVINEFMIQGGDPDSKGAEANAQLGNGGPGYQIDAEFVESKYHKKGALAAAREGDQINPEKKSSGSQFYIVHGKKFSDEELAQMEERINFPQKKKLYLEYMMKPENTKLRQRMDSLKQVGNYQEFNNISNSITAKLEPEIEKLALFKYSGDQKEMYSTIGGTPHLDQNYTVFGEVVEGLNVIDSIAMVKKGVADRPLEDVIMKMKVVKK
ncbi:MAG: peptidylprolyl isomerase [Salinivirgaceae bacterium]|nr:peptidylprolyl isomerase [Salinivirgaceae bacterium]